MASEERKAADAKIEEDNLFLSLGAADQQAETDAFQCGRCKQVGRLAATSYCWFSPLYCIRGNVVTVKPRRGALTNQ
jgi:hypothetical protein